MSTIKYQRLHNEVNELLNNVGIDRTIDIINSAIKDEKNNKRSKRIRWDDDIIRKLIKYVCDEYEIDNNEEMVNGTSRKITKARKICFAIMKYDLDMQYNSIALFFYKDESTVCRAIMGFQKDIGKDKDFKGHYEVVRDKFKKHLSASSSNDIN